MQEALDFLERALNATMHDPRFVLAGVCLMIAGVFNAVLDRLSNVGAFSTSIFAKWRPDFWLKSESWRRKYKRYSTGKLVVDHFDDKNKPVYKPAFTFLGLRSDKALVMFTDGWHLAQFFQWAFVCFGVVFAAGLSCGDWRFWALWFLLRGALTGSFSLFYSSIFRGRR